jgi:hypothetical protein
MQIGMGLANCSHCGAQVGTLFSETDPVVQPARYTKHKKIFEKEDYYTRVDKAQYRANNSVILALASVFFPGIGVLMAVFALVFSATAARTLKALNIEDGRGMATAGIVIGSIGLVAQAGYMIYIVRLVFYAAG